MTKLKKEVWIEISRLSFFSYDEKEEHSFYYIKDILGNIRHIVDKDGSFVVSYYYDAWGNIYPQYHSYVLTFAGETLTAEDVSNLNGLFYKGYYYDKENKLYYLITRYYDPEVGRFISPDDPQYLDFKVAYGYNRYAYCNNNPVMGYDPEGTFFISGTTALIMLALTAVAFVVGTTASVLDQGFEYGFDNINIWQAVGDGLFSAASTALSFTPIGVVGSMIAGGVLALGQYAFDKGIRGEEWNVGEVLLTVGLGVAGGRVTGAGSTNFSNIMNSMTQVSDEGWKAMKVIEKVTAKKLAGEISDAGFRGAKNLYMKTAVDAFYAAAPATIKKLTIDGGFLSISVTAIISFINAIA